MNSNDQSSSKRKPGWLREAMPTVAGMIDARRAAWGAEHVDAQIKAGMRGQADAFYAVEGGNVLGAPFADPGVMEAVGQCFMVAGAAMVMRAPQGWTGDGT